MINSAISLSPDLLAEIFPFHLAIDREWKVVQSGKVLQRICPGLNPNSHFEQYFQIQRPTTTFSFEAIQAHLQSLFILQVQYSAMLLKGQIVYLAKEDLLLFLGSPWIPDLTVLKSSSLALTDFAIHDPIADYLILLQAQKMALSDARKLADKLKQQRTEVRKALQREKELNDLKSRFITTASHEFRTPLGIIASSAGIMQDYAGKIDSSMQQKHLARIQAAVSRMTSLLDDVLTMNQAEAGRLKAHPQPLDVGAFCQEIASDFQRNTPHRFTYNISPKLFDRFALLDENLLDQILTNLLSNAIKYTPEPGDIEFDVSYEEGQIFFTVQDSGIGIPEEDLDAVFHPFHRASNVGNIAGTGLGLAIAKHCTDLHQGTLSIVSEIGVGTTITVTIPWQVSANSTEVHEESVAY